MKYSSLFILSLVFTLLLIPFYESAYSYTNSHNISVKSEQVEFGPASLRIDYQVVIDVERPSELDPGDSFTIIVSPRGGTVTYNIEVLGKTYSIPQNVNLGDEVAFNIVTGIDAYVSTSASSVAQILGPVSNNQQTLRWNNPTSEIIRGSVNNNVGSSGDIVVKIPIKINLDVGLNLNFLGIKQNLGERSLGAISAYPVIEEHISINRPGVGGNVTSNSNSLTWIFLIVIIIIIAIVVGVVSKRRKNKDGSKKSVVAPTFTHDTIKEIRKSAEEKSTSIQKESTIDSMSHWAYAVKLGMYDKIIGKISANGNFIVYLTNKENIKEFQEKKKRGSIKFYEEGKSEEFSYDFSYNIPHSGEFLLVILNEEKSTINVKLDYFVVSA